MNQMKKQMGVQKSILLEAGKDLEFGIPEIPGGEKKAAWNER